jgi:hypothetical protein
MKITLLGLAIQAFLMVAVLLVALYTPVLVMFAVPAIFSAGMAFQDLLNHSRAKADQTTPTP